MPKLACIVYLLRFYVICATCRGFPGRSSWTSRSPYAEDASITKVDVVRGMAFSLSLSLCLFLSIYLTSYRSIYLSYLSRLLFIYLSPSSSRPFSCLFLFPTNIVMYLPSIPSLFFIFLSLFTLHISFKVNKNCKNKNDNKGIGTIS